MQALGVVPVDPCEGLKLEVVDRPPGSASGSAHELGLVEGVDALGEGIIEAVADAADRRPRPDLVESFGVAQTRKLTARVGVKPISA